MDTNIFRSNKQDGICGTKQNYETFTDEHEMIVNGENAPNWNYICVKIIDS